MPETVGTLVLGAELAGAALFTIGATTVTAGAVVGGTILIAGSIGLQLLLARSAPAGAADVGGAGLPKPDAGHQALRQAIPPRISGYGENVRLAGSYMLFEVDTAGTSWDVIALLHGQIAAVTGYYLHDDVVELVGGGVQVLGDGRYVGGDIFIDVKFGLSTETAHAAVVAALPTIWTSAHRGDGIASAVLRCPASVAVEDFHNKYPRGKPELSVVANLIAILDPRDAGTRVTNNPVLQIEDFLTNDDRGMGFEYATLITPVVDALNDEADLCDELVAKADGSTEPRYTSRGTFPLDADPVNVVNTILDTCDGWLSENGDGSLALKVGVYRAPTFTLTADHIRGFSLQKGVADEEVVNELTINYTEASADYKTVPGQPWRDEASISLLGRVRSQPFALPWVYSHAQCRRLAKRRMAQLNASIRGTITTTLYGLRGLGERWIKIEAPEIVADLADLVIEVRGLTIDLLNATCTYRFVSVNPNEIDDWTPATEEGAAPVIPSKLVFPPPPVPTSIAAFAVGEVELGEGHASFIVSFADPGRSDLTFQTAWRVNGSGGAFTNDAPASPFVNSEHDSRPAVRGGYAIASVGTYEVKVRSFAPAGLPSAFSSTTTVTLVGG